MGLVLLEMLRVKLLHTSNLAWLHGNVAIVHYHLRLQRLIYSVRVACIVWHHHLVALERLLHPKNLPVGPNCSALAPHLLLIQ